MKRSRQYRRCGITLPELLVCIAVLALLSTCVVAGLIKAKEMAWVSQSTSNIRQLATANITYASDKGHFAPVANRNNTKRWCGSKRGDGSFDPTRGYLADYLGKSRKVTPCPLFVDMLRGAASFELGTGGYGYNDNYIGGRPEGQAGGRRAWAANGDRIAATTAQIHDPTRTVMFTTSAYASGSSVQEYPYSHAPYWDFGRGPSGMRPSPSTHFRFDGQAIVAWADGHVSFEQMDTREVGYNPHGGNASDQQLGWFGPDENNGFWNPDN